MKITVVNGTEARGVTYRLKELFLSQFAPDAQVTEFYLLRDCPGFCIGCKRCFLHEEADCKDAAFVQTIHAALLNSDLLVFTSPVYALHTTGAMKALLDHLCYRWMLHRPAPELFRKRAVILTQCLGAGARSAARDIRHSLSWWGISEIGAFAGALRADIQWESLPEARRALLTRKVQALGRAFARKDYSRPARVGLAARAKFYVCRMIQKSVLQEHPQSPDALYWQRQGWLGRARPWH